MTYNSGNSTKDHERKKFLAGDSGDTAVNVVVDGGSVDAAGGFNIPVHDTINVTYPTSSTEVYTYLASAVTVATITVTYATSSKANITSVVKS